MCLLTMQLCVCLCVCVVCVCVCVCVRVRMCLPACLCWGQKITTPEAQLMVMSDSSVVLLLASFCDIYVA